MPQRRRIIIVLLVIALAEGAYLLVRGDGGATDLQLPVEEAVVAPTPAPTETPGPQTPTATRSATSTRTPPTARPPTATPEPGREGPEVTLVEIDTSRSLRLWQTDAPAYGGIFTRDSRVFYFTRPDGVYGVDLKAAALTPSRVAEGNGVQPSPDRRWLLVSHGNHPNQQLYLVGHDGALRDLGPGVGGAWSPDGRWILFNRPFVGETSDKLLYDTWTQSLTAVGHSVLCHCDGLYQQDFWAPGSDAFFYVLGEGRRNQLYTVDGTHLGAVDGVMGWTLDGRSLLVRRQEEGTETTFLARIDVPSGEETVLLKGLPRVEGGAARSPDQTRIAVRGVNDDSFDVYALSGARLAASVAGFLPAWSSDGRHISAHSQRIPPCRGVTVYDSASFSLEACLDDATEGLRWSPVEPRAAYLKHDPATSSDPPYLIRNEIVVFDAEARQTRSILSDLRGRLCGLTWSPDGRWLLVTPCGV